MAIPSISILLVDDRKDVCAVISKRFRKSGFQVTCAYDGQEALNILQTSQAFHYIITDIDMPKKDGIELLHEVKLSFRPCEVIIITGVDSEHHAINALNLGALRYYKKPFDVSEMIDFIKDHYLKNFYPKLFENESARLSFLNLEKTEAVHIFSALQMTHNNVSEAAKLLGISRQTLHRKLRLLRNSP